MNAELKAKWIDALRSGKYKQSTRLLRTFDDHYCCLGVLVDIAGYKWTLASKARTRVQAYECDGRIGALTVSITEALGLSSDQHSILIKKNDSGQSFNQIADYIEANL